ncbi:glycosyltransferase family 2 protein [Methanolacinia paynteri]|uniref:glycosyltransferase family 2 protein n=1 Tax=Methanolacinia paynteri TaxID=230356 RepID=UPI0014705D69|nr:glycosyltransferase [Methanolacinia paynteri]
MISIIIPVLNEEETIAKCLRSLLKQNCPRDSYEIIIVDGGSSDNTCEIAISYADQVIRQKSEGIGGARREGAMTANGEILAFTDADTIHPPFWLEIIAKDLISGGYDVCTGPVRFYNRTALSCIVQGWRKHYNLLQIFGFFWLIGSNFAVRKDIYFKAGGHREISILEDYDLSLRLADVRALCICDKKMEALTSARRMTGIFGYTRIYLTGFYHYYITKNNDALLSYPQPKKISFQQNAAYTNLKQVRQKISKVKEKKNLKNLRLNFRLN